MNRRQWHWETFQVRSRYPVLSSRRLDVRYKPFSGLRRSADGFHKLGSAASLKRTLISLSG
jgi:hypothetical protein